MCEANFSWCVALLPLMRAHAASPADLQSTTNHSKVLVCENFAKKRGSRGEIRFFLFSLPNLYTYSDLQIHTLDSFFSVTVDDETALFAADDAAAVEWHRLSLDLLKTIALESHRSALRRLVEKS